MATKQNIIGGIAGANCMPPHTHGKPYTTTVDPIGLSEADAEEMFGKKGMDFVKEHLTELFSDEFMHRLCNQVLEEITSTILKDMIANGLAERIGNIMGGILSDQNMLLQHGIDLEKMIAKAIKNYEPWIPLTAATSTTYHPPIYKYGTSADTTNDLLVTCTGTSIGSVDSGAVAEPPVAEKSFWPWK